MTNNIENKRNDVLYVLAMGYYGNRTGIYINESQIDEVISGSTKKIRDMLNIVVDRKIVNFPNTDCCVVYDANYELTKHSYVVCDVPQIGLKVYDKCLFCKYDGKNFSSLDDDGYEQIKDYIKDDYNNLSPLGLIIDKEFFRNKTKYRAIGYDMKNNIVALETVSDDESNGVVDFIVDAVFDGNKIVGGSVFSYLVTKNQFFELIKNSKTYNTEGYVNAVKKQYYRIPTMLCEVIAQAYDNRF